MSKTKYIFLTIGLCAMSFSYGHSIQPSLPEPKPLVIEHIYQGEGQTVYKAIRLPVRLDLDKQGMVRKLSATINASQLGGKK